MRCPRGHVSQWHSGDASYQAGRNCQPQINVLMIMRLPDAGRGENRPSAGGPDDTHYCTRCHSPHVVTRQRWSNVSRTKLSALAHAPCRDGRPVLLRMMTSG